MKTMRRSFAAPWLPGALAATTLVVLHAAGPADRLAAARTALGGDRLLDATTTFVIKGTEQLDTRAAHRSAPFEIDSQLPDKFIWRESISGKGVNVLGFVKNKLISNSSMDLDLARPVSPQAGQNPAPTSVRDDQQMQVAKGHFTVVTLAMLAASCSGHSLHFAELPGGDPKAAAIGVSSDDGFGATLVFDPVTHLPDRLLYRNSTSDAAYVVEWRYSDFRDVEGRRVPFSYAYSTGNDAAHLETRWVYKAETVTLNARLDPSTFTVDGR
jgi:hypothetical protein